MKLAPHDTEQFKEVRDKDKSGRDRERAQAIRDRGYWEMFRVS